MAETADIAESILKHTYTIEPSLLGEALPSSHNTAGVSDHAVLTEHLVQLVELRKAAAKVRCPRTEESQRI